MRYGPQTPQLQALIERVGRLTPNEIQGLTDAAMAAAGDAWSAAWDAPRAAARAAAWAVARDASRDEAARDAARAIAWDAAWAAWNVAWADARATWDAAWDVRAADAVWAAALGLATRHLIGEVFTREHYRTLVGLAATVFGKLHPDD